MATLSETAGGAAGMRLPAGGQQPRLAAHRWGALDWTPECAMRDGDESRSIRVRSGDGEHPEVDRRAVDGCEAAPRGTALEDAEPAEARVLRSALHDRRGGAPLHRMGVHPDRADEVLDGLTRIAASWSGRIPS